MTSTDLRGSSKAFPIDYPAAKKTPRSLSLVPSAIKNKLQRAKKGAADQNQPQNMSSQVQLQREEDKWFAQRGQGTEQQECYTYLDNI
jgi:hypothetical protein